MTHQRGESSDPLTGHPGHFPEFETRANRAASTGLRLADDDASALLQHRQHGFVRAQRQEKCPDRRMGEDSDLDFAVSGLPPRNFYPAVTRAMRAPGSPVDVVDLDLPTPFTRHLRQEKKLLRVG